MRFQRRRSVLALIAPAMAGLLAFQAGPSKADEAKRDNEASVSYDVQDLTPGHSDGGQAARGTLSVAGTRVLYSGAVGQWSFDMSCTEFQARAQYSDKDHLHVDRGNGRGPSADLVEDTFKVGNAPRVRDDILMRCKANSETNTRTAAAVSEQQKDRANRERLKQVGARISAVDPPDASYLVVHHLAKEAQGTLSASGMLVGYAEVDNPAQNFSFSCRDFASQVELVARLGMRIGDRMFSDHLEVRKPGATPLPPIGDVYGGLAEHCRAAVLAQAERQTLIAGLEKEEREKAAREEEQAREREYEEREKAEREEEEARERAYAEEERRRAEERRSSLLAALSAAQEPDPFASIRGEYNLSAPVAGRWKTTFVMPGGQECGLVQANQASITLWTYGCLFRTPGDTIYGHAYATDSPIFEDTVKFLQSTLGLPYQPDLTAVGRNQVFFADPARPGWRVYAARLDNSTVSVSVLAIRPVATPFPDLSGSSTGAGRSAGSGTSVKDQIDAIVKSGQYSALPAPTINRNVNAPAGTTVLNIRNDTPYDLTVLLDGPSEQRLAVAPRSSASSNLAAGKYRVAGRVSATDVLPSYGEQPFEPGGMDLKFYIQ